MAQNHESEEYVIVDKIVKIDVSKCMVMDAIQLKEELEGKFCPYDLQYFQYLDVPGPARSGKKLIRQLACVLENGDNFIIGFDTHCYIMGNDGQTVETVIANEFRKY